jgi:hypothetical protein
MTRIYLGWWIAATVMCCLSVFWVFYDIRHTDWLNMAIDGVFTPCWFIIAHFAWEEGYYEE